MSWEGWFEYDGVEIINVARTEAYARWDSAGWFRSTYNYPELGLILGQGSYKTPMLDSAPWYDENVPESQGFYGLYPLRVSGLDDSTRQSTVVEHLSHGGNPGRLRMATRQVVFSAVLLANTEAGAQFGLNWLKRVLEGGDCMNDPGCNGSELRFFSSIPGWDPAVGTDCADDYLRALHRVVVNSGPTVSNRTLMSDGTSMAWTVSFTAVAGLPAIYGPIEPIVGDMFGVSDPVLGDGVTVNDDTPATTAQVDCPPVAYQPVYDPNCPAVVSPPQPPDVAIGCFDPPTSWYRYSISIPASLSALWTKVVPQLVVTSPATADVRNMRIRFYVTDPTTDACGFIGDLLIGYIPMSGILSIDGVEESVLYSGAAGVVVADSLIFSSDGGPFDWPVIACGSDITVTIDFESITDLPSLDLTLVGRENA
jgi:hypothetical protein